VELQGPVTVGYLRIEEPRRSVRRQARGGPIDMDMEAPTADIRSRVLTLIGNILKQNAIVADVLPETQLVDIGLNSTDMVALMLGVEAEFNMTLPQPEITPENFESVRTLESMILKLELAGLSDARTAS
jgi:acyl carrier protein